MVDTTAVTVLGLGNMGAALADAFLAAGHSTTVWNRTADKADPLVGKGARRAATVEEAVRASPVVVVCLLDYDAVHEVLDPVGGALRGRAVFNLTNGTPRQARDTAGWAGKLGCEYVDGGIMAVPQIIGSESAFVLYSGPGKAAFEAGRELLEVLGSARFVGDDAGLASLLDLALNGAMYGLLGGAMHAIAVVGTEGVKAQDFSAELLVPYLTSMTGIIPHFARQIDTGEYQVDVVAALGMQQVGYRNIRRASLDQGISTDLLDPMQSLMDRRVADGFADDDFSAVAEVLKNSGT
ncbi:NAD(P)-dependent oxidoreductase [Streptomyces johnsoniae]|uniref:NAD(P)-binding domain-containing protein n=1 Tax=Streptomyces johnsoniae TaxID=3075532 RepID=A0ABU2SF22_9ACTN|nr:NAD(P)-binding domain-containing protein [Streptomyces sp. DSM 41886]MDT0446474.1 NAD(P)-binding domain-containing protein [Streptomyces sp. DSM 41886]